MTQSSPSVLIYLFLFEDFAIVSMLKRKLIDAFLNTLNENCRNGWPFLACMPERNRTPPKKGLQSPTLSLG